MPTFNEDSHILTLILSFFIWMFWTVVDISSFLVFNIPYLIIFTIGVVFFPLIVFSTWFGWDIFNFEDIFYYSLVGYYQLLWSGVKLSLGVGMVGIDYLVQSGCSLGVSMWEFFVNTGPSSVGTVGEISSVVMTTDVDLPLHPDGMATPPASFSSNPLPTYARVGLFTLGVTVGLVVGVTGSVVVHAAMNVFL